MIKTQQRNLYWAHYNVLESDIDSMSRYIEFNEDNFATYSIQLVHFLLAVGSEVDVLLKELCKLLDEHAKRKNINHYKDVLLPKFSEITTTNVICRKYGLTLSPWSNWTEKCNPSWWQAYNSVKHTRNAHFNLANLENALNAISGLYLLNVYYNHNLRKKETDYPLELSSTILDLEPNIDLFRIDDFFMNLASRERFYRE